MKRTIALCLAVACFFAAYARAATKVDVPMERDAVSVVIRMGLNETAPATWEGSYRLDKGTIIATDGLRFTGDDYATRDKYRVNVRRFYPRFWNRRGRQASSLPMEPNGIILTLGDVTPSSVLELKTSAGDVRIEVGTLRIGAPVRALDGKISYQRVPVSRQVVQSATEDAYPSAILGPDKRLQIAYIAFTHGVGFDGRLPITTDPGDYSYLAKPTGGDQLMFTELVDGAWTEPLPLTDDGQDLFGTAMATDGEGRLWVFWAAHVDNNWDLYGKSRTGVNWSEPIRITSAAGSDFHHVATTAADGRIWLAWQSFGKTQSDICIAQQQDAAFGDPTTVGSTPANDWTPAIAAAQDGRVAVAWDTYQHGNYDVYVRVSQDGRWSDERLVAGTLQNEARASLAFDQQDRLWMAYEISPEGWGKDYGPYDQSPTRMPLYRARSIGVKVLHGEAIYAPEADVNRALPLPNGQTRRPGGATQARAASPKLAVDAKGRIYLAVRNRVERLDSAVGGTWMTFLTTLEAMRWRPAVRIPETDGFLHETSALVPAPQSGLFAVSATDGRFRAAAVFGLSARERNRRSEDAPPPRTRNYVSYPDWQFNKEIAVADTGTLSSPRGAPPLAEALPEKPAGPTENAVREREQVTAIRDYRAKIAGSDLRIMRGEFHRHTEISGDGAGDGSLFDMWRYGIDMAAMDWIGDGDHDNGGGREFSWWYTQKTTSIFNVPGAFASMFTYERSVNYPDGHRNAVFARRGIRPLPRLQGGLGQKMDDLPADAKRPNTPDTQMFYKYLRYFDGVCASHTSGTDMGTDWRDNDPKVEPIVEIYQGDRQSYERPGAPRSNTAEYSIGGWRPLGFVSLALLKGYRLGFQSSSDHISTHMSYCNVWVEEPTREAILEGLKKRRVYGATDNIIADVRCGEHFMGEEFTTDKRPTLNVKLIGTAPFAEVVIVKDNEYVYSTKPNTQVVEFDWTDHDATPGKTSYYYVRGTQVGTTQKRTVNAAGTGRAEVELNNGEIVWVSPMWITYKED